MKDISEAITPKYIVMDKARCMHCEEFKTVAVHRYNLKTICADCASKAQNAIVVDYCVEVGKAMEALSEPEPESDSWREYWEKKT